MSVGAVTFVCRDKEQHPTATLGTLRRLPNGWVILADDENVRRTVSGAKRPSSWSTRRADGGVTFHFECPRCGRSFERQERALVPMLVRLIDAEVRVVDIAGRL